MQKLKQKCQDLGEALQYAGILLLSLFSALWLYLTGRKQN